MGVNVMTVEEDETKDGTGYPEVMNDIHLISEELESLYNHYSRRIKNVSEELSRERSKHRLYQFEIAENHHTIQMLTEQIDYLLQDMELKHEIYLQLQHDIKQGSIPYESELINEATNKPENVEDSISGNSLWEVNDHLLPTAIPEIRVIYESTLSHKRSILEGVKNDVISLLMEANEYFLSESKRSIEVELYANAFAAQLVWIRQQYKQYMKGKNERWYTKMWNFLWGKQENNHPEIIKKLNLIEEHLESYSGKFNEVKESLNKSNDREETTQNYLQKMSALHEELKKIEEHYEEELHALRTQIEEFKQREKDLERQMTLMNEKDTSNQKGKSQREMELEKELSKLRQDLKSQSNKKNDLYNKMKQQSKQVPQGNPQFEEYGNIPMAPEAKRTMFNPNKYIR